jgi:hypothetical protein
MCTTITPSFVSVNKAVETTVPAAIKKTWIVVILVSSFHSRFSWLNLPMMCSPGTENLLAVISLPPLAHT